MLDFCQLWGGVPLKNACSFKGSKWKIVWYFQSFLPVLVFQKGWMFYLKSFDFFLREGHMSPCALLWLHA